MEEQNQVENPPLSKQEKLDTYWKRLMGGFGLIAAGFIIYYDAITLAFGEIDPARGVGKSKFGSAVFYLLQKQAGNGIILMILILIGLSLIYQAIRGYHIDNHQK